MGIWHGTRTAALIVGVVLLSGPATAVVAQATSVVTGQVTILERHNRAATDLAQTVLWLTGSGVPDGTPSRVEMATEGKQFTPRLAVLAPGSSVSFPNHDPFNHNVFSLSPEGPFDLGLYGRGEAKSASFTRTGVIRVYCNVHAQMRGLIVVVASGLIAQPGADGSFRFDAVPPGDYVLHAWHERGGESSQPLQVTAAEHAPVLITLDARGYRLAPHTRKNGQSYNDRGSRY